MVKKAWLKALTTGPVDCACLIHGSAYDWIYVQKLESMLRRHISRPINMHVWTERNRIIPDHYIKHDLDEWPGIAGPRKSWWYKMQMFDPRHFQGRLLYFDLDIVILGSLDWLLDLDIRYFWTLRDFRHHFRGNWWGINSSCMIWHTNTFSHVWQDFSSQNINAVVRQYQGDQDYLNRMIDDNIRRYLDQERIRSWRWEIKDGGMDFRKRTYKRPDAGSVIPPNTDIMVFHGYPKPHEILDPVIVNNWC